MAELVQSVLGLAARPRADEGPSTVAAWDSLGTLRLLLAIEETYGVSMDEAEMRSATTVAAVSTLIQAKLRAAAPGTPRMHKIALAIARAAHPAHTARDPTGEKLPRSYVFDDAFDPVWDEAILQGNASSGPNWWRLAREIQLRHNE